MLFRLARKIGVIKWPPYMAQLLPVPGKTPALSLRGRLQHAKSALLYELGHILPARPTEPLLEAIYVAYRRRQLTGVYAEFGVFSGRSTVRAYHYMLGARAGEPAKIFAFDSFRGLPELQRVDGVRYQDFSSGEYACSEADYLRTVQSLGVPRSCITTVPGWFHETCNASTAARVGLDRIAVAHIDCDIMSSTLDVLRFLSEVLEDGGIVVLDDYGSYRAHPELGQRGALARWQAERPDLWITPISVAGAGSASFSVHRKLTDHDR